MDALAYLVSRYPAVSHTFILREVTALREKGFRIKVASINEAELPPGGGPSILKEEREQTFYVKKSGIGESAKAFFSTLFRNPLGFLRGLWTALRLGGGDVKKWVYHLFYFGEALLIGQWMAKNDLHHIHVHFANPAAMVALILSKVFPVTYSLTIHGPDEFFDQTQQRLLEKIRASEFIFCIGYYARSQLMRIAPMSEWNKFEVCPLGVDINAFPARPFLESQHPYEILCVGRMVPAKGQLVLLKAVSLLVKEKMPVRVRLVGDGPDRKLLEHEVQDRGLSNVVVFTGSLSQEAVRECYKQTDLFVLASFAEGIPVVLMEAMAMEIPVISTYINGIPELIRNEIEGLLVAPSDEKSLARAIKDLLEQPEKRRSMGQAGRQRITEKYNLQTNISRLAQLFEQKLPRRNV